MLLRHLRQHLRGLFLLPRLEEQIGQASDGIDIFRLALKNSRIDLRSHLLVATGNGFFRRFERSRDLVTAGSGHQFVDKGLDLTLGQRAHEAIHRLPVLKGEDRRDRLNPKLAGNGGMLVDVHLHELHLATGRAHRIFDNRRQLLAWPAPGCPEVDQHGLIARFLNDIGRKAGGRRVLDQVSGRRLR